MSQPLPDMARHPRKHRRSLERRGSRQEVRDPQSPDYPFFQAHDAEARRAHPYGLGTHRWGRHPGFSHLDRAAHRNGRPVARPALRPTGALGPAVTLLSLLVTAVAWVNVVPTLPQDVAPLLSLCWLPAYVVTCLWLQVAHRNGVVIARSNQHHRHPAWVWCAWLVPALGLWIAGRIVDDAMWTTSRAALLRPLRATRWWWRALLAAVGGWACTLLPSWPEWAPGTLAVIDRGARVWTAVACTVALALWLPIVRRISTTCDRLAGAPRSTLVR